MRKNLIILILCLVFLFSVSGCFFNKTPSSVETTAAVSESDLTQKIELKGISYYIPADFQTMGKEDATILRHINTNDDNLLVGYLGDYDDSYMDTTEKHIELGSLAISSVKSSEGIDPDYDYTIISDLAVVKTTYTTKDTYNISYHFFANNGAYCMSYSSKEPISESNSKLLEKIVETVTPSANSTEALTTENITEKPTEPPTEKETEPGTEKPQIENNTSANGFLAEGNGDYVAEGLNVTNCAVLHFENHGEHNFIVTLYQGDKRIHSIVNEIGDYTGDTLVTGSGTYSLEIKSSGSWKVTSSGLSIDDTTSFSGHGDSVTGITSHGGGNWQLTHNGNHNFIVVPYSPDGTRKSSIVNEIGTYDGTVKVPTGNIFFEVKADGDWTIKKQ